MTESIHDFLDHRVLDKLRRPALHEARGLPASVYTEQKFFAFEQQHLFKRVWTGVAFVSDLSEPGDALPLNISGLPVILVRDAGGEIKAFHNVCRHRATIVLEQPCRRLRHFKCPYHGWTYALDGALKATPFWDGTAAADKHPVAFEENGLVPIRCAVWNHVVFVNPDGSAPPLEEYLAPMAAELAHLDIAALELGHQAQWEFKANWKLVMENWEVYHHVWVHQGVFDKMSDEVDPDGKPYTDMIADGNVLMLRPSANRPPRRLSGPAGALPPLAQRSITPRLTSTANAVLPNTTLSIGPVAYAPAVYTPLAPDLTRVSMAWYFAPGAGTDPRYEAGRNAILDRWLGPTRKFEDRQGIRPQDHRCMELQQAARYSPVADDVKFSAAWEANVRYFQDWLVRRLGA